MKSEQDYRNLFVAMICFALSGLGFMWLYHRSPCAQPVGPTTAELQQELIQLEVDFWELHGAFWDSQVQSGQNPVPAQGISVDDGLHSLVIKRVELP